MKRSTILLFILFIAAGSYAGKRLIEDKNQVIEAAKADIEAALKGPDGSLYKWAIENKAKGIYHLDITIHEKGKVATVFCSGSENGEIRFQNELKDILMNFEFSFKTPKGRDYKFSYSFTFN